MTNHTETPDTPDTTPLSFDDQLARNFAVAFVSCLARVSFRTVEKNYGGALSPSQYWLDLGKQVADDYRSGRLSALPSS
jgi:hypothetical protein